MEVQNNLIISNKNSPAGAAGLLLFKRTGASPSHHKTCGNCNAEGDTIKECCTGGCTESHMFNTALQVSVIVSYHGTHSMGENCCQD